MAASIRAGSLRWRRAASSFVDKIAQIRKSRFARPCGPSKFRTPQHGSKRWKGNNTRPHHRLGGPGATEKSNYPEPCAASLAVRPKRPPSDQFALRTSGQPATALAERVCIPPSGIESATVFEDYTLVVTEVVRKYGMTGSPAGSRGQSPAALQRE